MKLKCILTIGLISLSGCGFIGGGSNSEQANQETKEGIDITKNPLQALGALASAGSEMEKLQKELSEMPATEAVHFSTLIEALPDVPSGWTATDAKGSTTEMGDAKISTAERTYREEGGERTVTVSVNDWAFHQMLYMPFFMIAKFKQESTDGYQKGITVGDWPGMEEYKHQSKSGERSLLVNKRFHVKVDLRNGEAEEMEAWFKRVKLDALPTS